MGEEESEEVEESEERKEKSIEVNYETKKSKEEERIRKGGRS